MPGSWIGEHEICCLRALVFGGLAVLLAGCLPTQNAAMHGGPDGVSINYVGDVGATLPIARQHCARYERVPVLASTKDNTVTYACVRASATP